MQIGIDKETLTQELRRLGIARGMDVLVHSSLSSIGWVEGGADTVIDALLAAVSPAGTILMPALNGSPQDSPQNPPRMDVRRTPCPKWIGIIPETFRRREGVRRSLHPTHSMREEMVGNALCRLIDARAMREVLLPVLRKDPLWLLSDRARERFSWSWQS
jgi:aminoglycoside N3'-acetyltransferase